MEKTFKITSPVGLHARPSTVLVAGVTPFASVIQIKYKDKTVNLKSILGVMSLGVSEGEVITIKAEGSDEEAAIAKVAELMISEGLGQEC
ncbi:HPr family phosphocarrier protein [Viridibacillus sp. YIM B01967]|uniref:Phosphocarrier protein HPr n=2 Tax=Viridibacillus soli TaxID=2798301 RepID=A0ABS1H1W4_9BACL|nr:HPr family phosphocarrier protein [Viridibacillus soli]